MSLRVSRRKTFQLTIRWVKGRRRERGDVRLRCSCGWKMEIIGTKRQFVRVRRSAYVFGWGHLRDRHRGAHHMIGPEMPKARSRG